MDTNGIVVKVGDTIEIKNGYTNFSTRFPKSRQLREPVERGSFVVGYHPDKFSKVTRLKRTERRGKQIYKVHFVTDSGFETWRIARNLSVYDGERGCINDESGAGKSTSTNHEQSRYKGGGGRNRKPPLKTYEIYKGATPGMRGGMCSNAIQSKGKEDSSRKR